MNCELLSIDQSFRDGPCAPQSKVGVAGGARPFILQTSEQDGGEFADPAIPALTLHCYTGGAAGCAGKIGGETFGGLAAPGVMTVAPPDTEVDYVIDGRFSIMMLAIPSSTLKGVGPDDVDWASGDLGPLHVSFFRDPFIRDLADRMFRAARADTADSRMLLDSAVLTILVALFEKAGQRLRPSPKALDLPQLQRVLSHIEDRLEENVTLAELAAEQELSEWQFGRSFTASVGQPPYQYVLERRIARARSLLEGDNLPLAEIAYACGFSSQAHMTTVFRKKLGVTPGRYRQEVRR